MATICASAGCRRSASAQRQSQSAARLMLPGPAAGARRAARLGVAPTGRARDRLRRVRCARLPRAMPSARLSQARAAGSAGCSPLSANGLLAARLASAPLPPSSALRRCPREGREGRWWRWLVLDCGRQSAAPSGRGHRAPSRCVRLPDPGGNTFSGWAAPRGGGALNRHVPPLLRLRFRQSARVLPALHKVLETVGLTLNSWTRSTKKSFWSPMEDNSLSLQPLSLKEK